MACIICTSFRLLIADYVENMTPGLVCISFTKVIFKVGTVAREAPAQITRPSCGSEKEGMNECMNA